MTDPQCPLPPDLHQATVDGLSQVTTSLFLSSGADANNRLLLTRYNITTVINVSAEAVNTFYENIQYVHVPVTDTPNSKLYNFLDPISDHIHTVDMKQGRTLLHCVAGVSRSASFCMAYLMKYHRMSLRQAYIWTKSCRPIIHPNPGFWEQLIQYEFRLFSKNTVHMINSSTGMIPDVYNREAILRLCELSQPE